ncbi:MAG: glycosyltransferase family 39 protein, partial [Actinomycetia bacterium]|nr:glycosyltransferase family 39 protein [Actinomycetes bacterium]
MKSRENRKATTAILLVILVLALLLRVFNVGHVLSWDEAWNVNSVVDAATGHTDDASTFFPNLSRHPPAYTGLGILYAWVTGSGRVGVSIALEVISIICSLLLILVIFMCGRDWFDYRAGLLASFFFAVMPAARVYDTWVKQESMTLLLGLLFLLLFFRGRHVAAGLFLGLALLTKEIIVFIPLALVVFLTVTRRFGGYRKLAISLAVAIPLSVWWYLFFSRTSGQFADFFLGKHESAVTWARPWYFYLKRIPGDVGWVAFLAALIGIAFMARRLWLFRRVDRSIGPYAPRDMALFIVIWLAVIYLVLSLSGGKPPWMAYSALPAFALLGGWGLSEAFEAMSPRRRTAALASLTVAVVLAVALSVPVSFGGYVSEADVMWRAALRDKEVAEQVNRWVGAGGRIMLRDADLSPNLAFYMDCYDPGCMTLLPLERSSGDRREFSFLLLDDRTDLEEAR